MASRGQAGVGEQGSKVRLVSRFTIIQHRDQERKAWGREGAYLISALAEAPRVLGPISMKLLETL